VLVLAHAGHWLVQVAYLAPLILLVGMLLYGKWKARREERGEADEPDGEPE